MSADVATQRPPAPAVVDYDARYRKGWAYGKAPSAFLVEAAEAHLAGAALDVFAVEPLPSNHAFYGMENVLISFHCADLTADYHDLALDCFIENATNVVKGQPLTHVVDKALGY